MKSVIVDDDPISRTIIARVLQERGHDVISYAEAETAWADLQQQACDLLVTDWHLPGMDGLELCRRVRSLPAGQHTEILLITADTQADALRLALEAGANDFLSKPFNLPLLALRLTIAERHRNTVIELASARYQSENVSARYAALAEHATDLISVLAADGTILYASPSYQPILGFAPEDIVGHCVFSNMHPDDVTLVRDLFATVLQTKSPVSAQFRLRHRDETWRRMETTAVNHLEDPAVHGIIATTRDITDRALAEEICGPVRSGFARLWSICQQSPISPLLAMRASPSTSALRSSTS